jgi:hypothetical protein
MNLLRARNPPHLLSVSSSASSTGRKPACGLGLAGRPGSTGVSALSRRPLVRNAGWLRFGLLLVLTTTLLAAAPDQPETLESRFQRICSLTDSAVDLPTGELKALVMESEQLIEEIEASDLPQKKVLIFRLKKCRGLFQYLLQVRNPVQGESGERVQDSSTSPPDQRTD